MNKYCCTLTTFQNVFLCVCTICVCTSYGGGCGCGSSGCGRTCWRLRSCCCCCCAVEVVFAVPNIIINSLKHVSGIEKKLCLTYEHLNKMRFCSWSIFLVLSRSRQAVKLCTFLLLTLMFLFCRLLRSKRESII